MEFKDIFPMPKPIIGMLHLAGEDPVERALEERQIYADAGLEGVIVENYHGTVKDVIDVLEAMRGAYLWPIKGINILGDYEKSFELAEDFGCSFIQIDSVQFSSKKERERYLRVRRTHVDVVVLGGVRFKYQPSTGRSLKEDIEDAWPLCDAIVTTGTGTGIETPIQKLIDFREVMPPDAYLIEGAGVNAKNAYSHAKYHDGVIVGSAFKPGGDTYEMAERPLVELVKDPIKRARSE